MKQQVNRHLHIQLISWWRHQMETFSALLAICAGNSPVTGEFPTQRPVTRSFDVYFDLRPNERLGKQSWGWWFETLSSPLWRHRNVWSLLLSNAYQLFPSNVWVLQHHSVHPLNISTIIVLCIWGWSTNEISVVKKNSRHTSCIHTGLHAGKWPDLMTFKPEDLSTLGYHWTDCTGTTLADAIAQWSSSGNLVLICPIGTHWKTTGVTSTLGNHWNHTGWCLHPVVSQWQPSVNLHSWNTLDNSWKTTRSTLETHWLPTIIYPVAFQCALGTKFQAHWIATGLPLAQGKGKTSDAELWCFLWTALKQTAE